jgi:hypothetical protein
MVDWPRCSYLFLPYSLSPTVSTTKSPCLRYTSQCIYRGCGYPVQAGSKPTRPARAQGWAGWTGYAFAAYATADSALSSARRWAAARQRQPRAQHDPESVVSLPRQGTGVLRRLLVGHVPGDSDSELVTGTGQRNVMPNRSRPKSRDSTSGQPGLGHAQTQTDDAARRPTRMRLPPLGQVPSLPVLRPSWRIGPGRPACCKSPRHELGRSASQYGSA